MAEITSNAARVRRQLKQAKVSLWGRRSMEARFLPKIIHSDETIHAAVFGYCTVGMAMLIATDKRIIFLDRKPMFTNQEEITYRAISGVRVTDQALFSTLMLETRIGNYTLSLTNSACARRFERYIESNWLEASKSGQKLFGMGARPKKIAPPATLTDAMKAFLRLHEMTVISTSGGEGGVHGSSVHYLYELDDAIYILSHSASHKAKNVEENNEVFLTIHDDSAGQTMQIEGLAEIDENIERKNYIFSKAFHSSYGNSGKHPAMPNDYVVLRITPISAKLT